jgi:hypothetical protein
MAGQRAYRAAFPRRAAKANGVARTLDRIEYPVIAPAVEGESPQSAACLNLAPIVVRRYLHRPRRQRKPGVT